MSISREKHAQFEKQAEQIKTIYKAYTDLRNDYILTIRNTVMKNMVVGAIDTVRNAYSPADLFDFRGELRVSRLTEVNLASQALREMLWHIVSNADIDRIRDSVKALADLESKLIHEVSNF